MTRPATHRMPAVFVGLILAFGIAVAVAGFLVEAYQILQLSRPAAGF